MYLVTGPASREENVTAIFLIAYDIRYILENR
jgi:hypothetical protein